MTLPYILIYIALGIVVLLTLLNLKTSRADGTLIKAEHKVRKMMPFLMVKRNESLVYFDKYVNAEPLLAYLEKAKEKGDFDCDITHAVVAAAAVGLHENPTMNRFIAGRRLYQRHGAHVTFSLKRKAMNRRAKVAIAKLEIPGDQTYAELCERMNASINVERSGKKTYTDKELDIFMILPRPILRGAVALAQKLNYYNLLPKSFIDGDAMFASMVVANLGSLGMDAGFHHFYEWGTASLFLMMGKIQENVIVVDGEMVIQKQLHLRYTFDERIDDGLNGHHGMESMRRVLENPDTYLGCLNDEGTDHRPFNLDAPPAA